jgi:hypothetical protein
LLIISFIWLIAQALYLIGAGVSKRELFVEGSEPRNRISGVKINSFVRCLLHPSSPLRASHTHGLLIQILV